MTVPHRSAGQSLAGEVCEASRPCCSAAGREFESERETMAGRIDKFLKERLQAAGQWQAFQQRRDELKAQGYNAGDARTAALAEVMPKAGSGADAGDTGGDGADVAADGPRGGSLPLAPAALAGKIGNETDIARWVARNIDNPAASAEECPDAFAWTLLRMCRENAAFALMFVKDIWTKLLVAQAKQGDAGETDGEIDGTPTLKLIERIRAIRDHADPAQA
ncbi:MAG: hypothetical protein ABFD92_19830 [Planctomycetaceae bacterium]|nr:hypothetical protein [Planctomycetaceae bacterium]